MIHLGDITKINGAEAPVVDVIIGGSPCQDLSMAGKRAGLAGERSGLYMEQLRVIKEMRHHDELCGRTGQFIRPRYMVWENVPGAFSCNHGEDFSAVLTEAVRVIEPEAPDVPVPEKGWPAAGVLLGDQWSIAWRVLDAQYWGVPQRRRRIALVCDFGGQSAPEILFVSNSLQGHPEPSRAEGEGAAGDPEEGTAYTSVVIGIGNGQANQAISDTVGALNCMHDQQAVFAPDVAHGLRAKANMALREDMDTLITHQMTVRRLTPLECERLQGYPDGWTNIGEWVDSKGKKHKDADSPRYKALGNSIAIPPWRWVIKRLCAQYERTATMASLFDGIGGFPLIWEGINGKGSCLWASEIEEFPMAVTKIRFGGSL